MFDDIILYTTPEKTAETLAFARKLGGRKVLVAFTSHAAQNKEKLAALGAEVASGLLVRDAREAQKAFGQYDFLLGVAERELVEDRRTMLLYGAEKLEAKDKTHRRGSGLNQVTAKLLSERGKTYLFDLSTLLEADATEQSRLLGRMSQNKKILEKYAVKMMLCSFATSWEGARAVRERKLLLETL